MTTRIVPGITYPESIYVTGTTSIINGLDTHVPLLGKLASGSSGRSTC